MRRAINSGSSPTKPPMNRFTCSTDPRNPVAPADHANPQTLGNQKLGQAITTGVLPSPTVMPPNNTGTHIHGGGADTGADYDGHQGSYTIKQPPRPPIPAHHARSKRYTAIMILKSCWRRRVRRSRSALLVWPEATTRPPSSNHAVGVFYGGQPVRDQGGAVRQNSSGIR